MGMNRTKDCDQKVGISNLLGCKFLILNRIVDADQFVTSGKKLMRQRDFNPLSLDCLWADSEGGAGLCCLSLSLSLPPNIIWS